jgi:DivIVA domain-containing protein
MTLTLDDVRNKRFRMARKGGYEVLEVDEFVDEVEESFGQLVEENASLKKQVDALRSGSPDRFAEPDAVAAPSDGGQTEQTAPAAQPVEAPPSAPVPEPERIVVTASAEASSAVVRLVQLSTEQAEHLVREANDEAARIREDASRTAQQVTEDAQTRAERLEAEARVNAERLDAETQTRSETLDHELSQRRTELFGDLDRQRETLTETVARLRDFEQHYRANLHDHLRDQLDTLDRVSLEPQGGPERTAPREPFTAPTDGETSVRTASDPESRGAHVQGAHDDSEAVEGSGPSDTPRLDALLGDQR